MAKESPVTSTAMFSGAHHQSFQGADFRAAGNDIYMPTFHVSFNGQGLTPTSGPSSDQQLEEFTPKQRRNRFVQQVSRLFRSPQARNALSHHPPQHSARSADSATYSSQQNAQTPSPLSADETDPQSPPEDDINVSALDDLDMLSIQAQVVTNAEIYVRNMLCARTGLACWSPRPRKPFTGERGVVPGDVGTYDLTDGFKTIFNIWRDDALLKRMKVSGIQLCQLPPNEATFHIDELKEGATIVSGTTSNVHESQDGQITSFEFHCTSEQGAVLACTSSADLEELVHPVALRDFLVQHAGIIYQHANDVRRVADEDSLYIISGCIKSDSWALAAYRDPAQAPHDVLKLVRKTAGSRVDQTPAYMWTHRGTAEARSDSTTTPVTSERHQRKDQCLFLRGYKLCFSKDFRHRLKDSPQDLDHGSGSKDAAGPSSEGPDHTSHGGKGQGQGRGGGANPSRNENQGSGSSSGNRPSGSQNLSLETGVRIYSFPPPFKKTIHPCDKIADMLLKMTGADCALSHDDDWRLGSDTVAPWDDDSCIDLLQNKVLSVRNGVAYLSSTDELVSQPSNAVSQAVVLGPSDIWNVSSPEPVAIPAPEILPLASSPSNTNVAGRPAIDLSDLGKVEPFSSSEEDTQPRHSRWPLHKEEEAVSNEGVVQSTFTGSTEQVPINSGRSKSPSAPSAASDMLLGGARDVSSVGQSSPTEYPPGLITADPARARWDGETGVKESPSAPIHSVVANRQGPYASEYTNFFKEQPRSRVTVVCLECKRLKLKCDRNHPCSSCLKRNTVERCMYSAAAAEKVDLHSLNNRLTAMEAVMGAYSRGVPIEFTPTFPPAVREMEERIAAYVKTGGVVKAAPERASAQPTDHHHGPAEVKPQPFSFSAPFGDARSSTDGEGLMKVEQRPRSNLNYPSQIVKSLAVSHASFSAISKSTKINRRPVFRIRPPSSPMSKENTGAVPSSRLVLTKTPSQASQRPTGRSSLQEEHPDSIWVLGVRHPGSRQPSESALTHITPTTPWSGTPSINSNTGSIWPEEFYHDFNSLVWLTHRSNFPSILKDDRSEDLDKVGGGQLSAETQIRATETQQGGVSTDSGWGHMIRTSQSLLANALQRVHLGRDWRRPPNPVLTPEYATYVRLLTWFMDTPAAKAPFSIHMMASAGKELGTPIGKWFGPRVAGGALEMLVNSWSLAGMGVANAVNGVIDQADVYSASHTSSLEAGPSEDSLAWGTNPVLVLIPTRFGTGDSLHPIFHDTVEALFTFPQSVGIAGGRPSSSRYFVAIQEDHLLYLDPQFERPSIPFRPFQNTTTDEEGETQSEEWSSPIDSSQLDPREHEGSALNPAQLHYCTVYTAEELQTFHCDTVRKVPLSLMDSSVLIGFLCKSEEEWVDLRRRVSELPKIIFRVQDEIHGTDEEFTLVGSADDGGSSSRGGADTLGEEETDGGGVWQVPQALKQRSRLTRFRLLESG